MSTENTKKSLTLEQINELKVNYFSSLKQTTNPNNSAIFELSVDNDYTGLLTTISSLISVSQSAIEGMVEFNLPYCNIYDITSTLEIAKNLIPYSEIEFLDKIKETD